MLLLLAFKLRNSLHTAWTSENGYHSFHGNENKFSFSGTHQNLTYGPHQTASLFSVTVWLFQIFREQSRVENSHCVFLKIYYFSIQLHLTTANMLKSREQIDTENNYYMNNWLRL